MNRQRILFLLGLGVGGALLWLSLRNAELTQIPAALAAANWWLTAPFLLALFCFYWVKTYRWRIIVSPLAAVSTRSLFPAVMIGYAGSTVLPMQLGEVLRTYIASRKLGLRMSTVLASIVLERIFDLLTILVLLGITLLSEPELNEVLRKTGLIVAAIAAAGVAVTVFIIAWTGLFLRICRMVLAPLPARLRELVLDQLSAGAQGLASLRQPRLLLLVTATSFAQWVFMWICCYLSLLAFAIDVPISAAFVVLSVTVISVTLPSSPGFIGNIQFAYTIALASFGIAATDAFAASVYYHVLAYFSVLLVGGAMYLSAGYSLSQVRENGSDRAG